MKADIITIGNELLIGQIIDTNSKWIAEKVNLLGFEIRQITSVSDNKDHIMQILDEVSKFSDLIIITGGLGPTDDDLTKETLTSYFNTKLVMNEQILEDVKRFIGSKGFSLNDRNIKQAEVPENCTIIRNLNGTAPGMLFEKKEKVFISLPAVPFEMKKIFTERIIPILKEKFKTPKIVHKTVLTYGIPESSLAEKVNQWEMKLDDKIKLAYLPSPERIRLRLSMTCKDEGKALNLIDQHIEDLKKIIGKAIFGYGDYFLEDVIGKILKENHQTLSTAESCTGGNIGRLITSVPGSSIYYKGGVIAYSNEIKNQELDIPNDIIENFGAVSKEVVESMAIGVRRKFNTDYSIAVSGIAGPDGGTVEKPVGTTWIAVSDKEKVYSKMYIFGKMRDVNVRITSSKALDMLRKFALGYYDV